MSLRIAWSLLFLLAIIWALLNREINSADYPKLLAVYESLPSNEQKEFRTELAKALRPKYGITWLEKQTMLRKFGFCPDYIVLETCKGVPQGRLAQGLAKEQLEFAAGSSYSSPDGGRR